MNLKDIVIAVLISLLFASGYFTAQRASYISPAEMDTILADGTRVLSAEIVDLKDIRDHLASENEQALGAIDSLNNRIAAIARINVGISVYRDSVESLTRQLDELSTERIVQVIREQRDTTAVWSETFNDGLFRVTSRVGFTARSITNMLDLEVLRQPHIDIIVSEAEQGQLTFFARSEDFDIDFEYVHQPTPVLYRPSWPERNWAYIAAGTFVAGVWLAR